MLSKPPIVCLCGSTRFKSEYLEVQKHQTLLGNIVLSVGLFAHADNISLTPEQKSMLDELHLRKIDIADKIIVICPDNYIGESTKLEINYAKKHGKSVEYSYMKVKI